MATSVSPGKTNLSQTLSFEKRNILRDPSFSSYLNSSDENFIVKLTESTRKPTPPTMSPLGQSQGPVHRVYAGRAKDIEDEEIGVFGAEKYFQGDLEEKSTRKVSKDFSTMHLQQNGSSQVQVQVKSTQSSLVSANTFYENQKKQLGTRSVCSESSVNSRSAFLHKVPRNRANSKGSYVKNFFASLGCNCNDGAAVEVDEQSIEKGSACSKEITKSPLVNTLDFVQEIKSMPRAKEEMHINSKKEECFSFPVLSLQEEEKDKKNTLNLEKKISMLNNWDAVVPRDEESYGMYNNDASSDASSDLFELESFSTNGMSSCMTPITCYAPSEASIEWSVVTASAADCYEGINGKPNNLDRMVRNAKIGKMGKDRERRRTGILLGCTSDKAVKIVENEYRSIAGEKVAGSGHRRNPITPVTRFRGESKITRYDSPGGHGGFRHCSLPQSHSPLSYIFSNSTGYDIFT